MRDKISVKGAREHNLKNIDIEIPRDRFVVITGLSGSGKSSLAFDTIYAEGQRRYVESLSSYARQFLGQMEKPDIDYIEGLSPAISIDQKTTSRNPRSTVGTVTEIYDYLRLLFARIGVPHCPVCGKEIKAQTVDQMVDEILNLPNESRIQLLAPVVRGRKGEYQKLIENAGKSGFVRIRIDGETYDLQEITEEIKPDKRKKHNIEIVVDRLVIRDEIRTRLSESVETVLGLSDGVVLVDVIGDKEILFSQSFACEDCSFSMDELQPRMFSFNNPYGACPHCTGLGTLTEFDPDLLIPDKSKSLADGAIVINGWNISDQANYARMIFNGLSERYNFSQDIPFKDLPSEIKDIILFGMPPGEKIEVKYTREYGNGTFLHHFEGIVNTVNRRYNETSSDSMKQYYEGFMAKSNCPVCKGARLKPEVLAVTVDGMNMKNITEMPIDACLDFFLNINLSDRDRLIANQILKEINTRLGFLVNVGLNYLSLSRSAGTLSGGESQRIRLATQIGSGLMGVLYILDEPSIGLHQRDNKKLLKTLKNMRDLGNTLVVVEHDEDTMYAADHIIDMGPGAGIHGGFVVAEGTVNDIMRSKESVTGRYLSGKEKIDVPLIRREGNGNCLMIRGASENNLKSIDVIIPLGMLVSVTGVSGSGKSSLINEILYKELSVKLNGSRQRPGKFKDLSGYEHLDKVIDIDQSPIGRTPRSNPATYTGVFDLIRETFALTPEAKIRGYKNGRFSFNVRGGRCEACGGDGIIKIEMHFLPNVYVPCEVCKGKRYNRETLEVKFRGRSIADVLDMTVETALDFFKNNPRIMRKLQTLYDVGLGYIKLGQSSTTLSGGEAQRIKLAAELSKRSTGKTIYILDEPTTGLHVADVHRLITILQRLVDSGNTVLVIEHNLDVIKVSDHIIDLGPEGGDKGGYIIAAGTPEEIRKNKESYTAEFLNKVLRIK